jgi:hypothetical protein
MKIFDIKNHIEIGENYQGMNFTEFSFSKANFSNESLLLEFIKSRSFTHESLQNVVKEDLDSKYLRQAFDSDLLEIKDFKILDKKSLEKYLIDYSKSEDWSDDKKDFEILLMKFFKILQDVKADSFYMIDKDWFKESEKLRDPENWIYTYYFLIFWIDNNLKTISVAEWSYD